MFIDLAYIGPGAGIAIVGSFLAIVSAMFAAFLAILLWPVRRVWRALRGGRSQANARVKRVVIVGLDGLEPTLVEKYLEAGLLPNMAKLKAAGGYTRLGTTCPPLSPVAWSSFSTGTNPGKHNIFDFIDRDPHDYKPRISSVRTEPARRSIRLGKYLIPLGKPSITPLRKSKPFWNVLSDVGVFSAVIRVPITYPPDKFRGVQLSAMCVPDLRGTQGMFTYYTEADEDGGVMDGDVGGERIRVSRAGDVVQSELIGPENPFRTDRIVLRMPFKVDAATLHVDGQTIPLTANAYTAWVRIAFSAAPGIKVYGICRFFLKRAEAPFEMYCTAVQIDPDKPAVPISQPAVYSTYLARQLGTFATLGLAEDTWSLSEGVIDEDDFLTQAYDIHDERERMLLDALERVPKGMVACVFDAPDRIQHMFWRFTDPNHPALQGRPNTHPDTIREMYCRMDETVGKVLAKLDDDEAVIVMSDHGFKPFRRGVDLNAWLLANGYLKLKNGATSSDRQYLADIDWTETRVYAIGLAGMFINRKGREKDGIVPAADATALIAELAEKLTGLDDPEAGEIAIHEAIPATTAYSGPYVDAAPDLIIGYNVGFRVAWDAAVGKCGPAIFTPNTKAWSGDHCVHPALVPGVMFSNIEMAGQDAGIIDVAPTTLALLGVDTPAYMDGKSLL
jgi:predicted AlkP superfamily phosphohydrolase/phosphomutase